jgi:hypothetical protein
MAIALSPIPEGSSPAVRFRFTLTTRRLPDMMAFPACHGSRATTRVAKRDVVQLAVAGPVFSGPDFHVTAAQSKFCGGLRERRVSHSIGCRPYSPAAD